MPTKRSHSLQRALLVTVIVAFGVYSVIAVVDHGVVGFIEEAVENTATLQVLIDLSIVATLALICTASDLEGMTRRPFAFSGLRHVRET